jgi:hypothetical protein
LCAFVVVGFDDDAVTSLAFDAIESAETSEEDKTITALLLSLGLQQ